MTPIETAWLAGLLEGEGTFLWRRSVPSYYGVPMIRVKMADRDIIERVQALIGGNLLAEEARQEGWKRQYYVSLQGDRALEVMKSILSMMGARRSADMRALITRWEQRPGTRRGADSSLSKLTEEEVLKIRARYAAGERQCDLADFFGVTQGNIGHIVRRRSWKHI